MILKKFLLLMTGVLAYVGFQSWSNSNKIFANENALIPRSLLFGNPEKASARLSPQGAKLGYLAPDANNVLNVWVKDIASDAPAQMVTSDTKRGIRGFIWQVDETHILYVQDKEGDENWHLYQTNLSTKETKDLTPYPGVQASILAYYHEMPAEALILMNHRDKENFDVYRLHLATGELKLDTQNPGGVIDWLADFQLNVRASGTMTSEGDTVIATRASTTSPWEDIVTIGAEELRSDLISFNQKGDSLYFLSSLGGNTVRLLELNLSSKQISTVLENPDYDIDTAIFNPQTRDLEAVSYNGEKLTIQPVDDQIATDLQWLQSQVKGVFSLVSRDVQNKHWIVAVNSDVHSTAFYVFSRPDRTLQHLFSTQPELDKYSLSPMQPITFKARDGLTLHGYLTTPAGKEAKNLPLILLVHGGPWSRDNWGLHPEVQWLANRGYAVLQVNFRGSKGYGKSHLNAGNREWGRKMHHDLLDAKQWVIKAGIADPAKVAIYGASYGGYATLAGLSFTPEEFVCGVDIVGPSNLITLMQTLPPYWKPLKAKMDQQVGCLETEPDFLKERSPLYKAHQITKPLLIAQGANDPRVKQSESDQIVEEMRKNNLPVEYLLFADEGHGFARPENRLRFYAAAEAFLAKYLGGRVEKTISTEDWEALRK